MTATPSRTASPRPGVRGDMFAGRSTRSLPLRYGREVLLPPRPVAERDDVGTAREQLVGELRGDAAPGRGVLAVHDAEVDGELARAATAAVSSTARRPGAPNTSATNRMRMGL